MSTTSIPEDARRAAIRTADEARQRTRTTEGALLAELADAVAAIGAWAANGELDAIAIDRAMGANLEGIAAYRAGEQIAGLELIAEALERASVEAGAIKDHQWIAKRAATQIKQATSVLRGLLTGGGA